MATRCGIKFEFIASYSIATSIVREKCSQNYNTSSADDHVEAARFKRAHPALVFQKEKLNIENLFEKAAAIKKNRGNLNSKLKKPEQQNEENETIVSLESQPSASTTSINVDGELNKSNKSHQSVQPLSEKSFFQDTGRKKAHQNESNAPRNIRTQSDENQISVLTNQENVNNLKLVESSTTVLTAPVLQDNSGLLSKTETYNRLRKEFLSRSKGKCGSNNRSRSASRRSSGSCSNLPNSIRSVTRRSGSRSNRRSSSSPSARRSNSRYTRRTSGSRSSQRSSGSRSSGRSSGNRSSRRSSGNRSTRRSSGSRSSRRTSGSRSSRRSSGTRSSRCSSGSRSSRRSSGNRSSRRSSGNRSRRRSSGNRSTRPSSGSCSSRRSRSRLNRRSNSIRSPSSGSRSARRSSHPGRRLSHRSSSRNTSHRSVQSGLSFRPATQHSSPDRSLHKMYNFHSAEGNDRLKTLTNSVNEMRNLLSKIERRNTENDRRLSRVEVTANKTFVLVGDLVNAYDARTSLVSKSRELRLPRGYRMPKLPIKHRHELSILMRDLKNKDFFSFLVSSFR